MDNNGDMSLVSLARSINLTRFTFLDHGSLFLRNKSHWIHNRNLFKFHLTATARVTVTNG